MNLAFTEDELAMRDEFRRVLASSGARQGLNRIEAGEDCDRTLWQRLAETGWLAAGIAEADGGNALGDTVLCLLAEESGRQAVAVPFVASSCGYAGGLATADDVIRRQWLPRLADGSQTGIVLTPQDWNGTPALQAHDGGWTLSGRTGWVRAGAAATAAMARVDGERGPWIVVFALPPGERLADADRTLDVLHPPARFEFRELPVTVIAAGDAAERQWQALLDRCALFVAFEQLGGAQVALDMARDYSLTRYAFGRAIGSFQALKHAMADMLAAVELARSNCYYGAAALDGDAETFAEAAAVARIAATDAYRLCARQNLQIHGGIGVTWEADAHLHYRRAQSLATALGTPAFWKERLIAQLIARRRPAHASTTP
ncbi:MAG: acyl-CoA dehydrogenase family protein [Solimonas sp.]